MMRTRALLSLVVSLLLASCNSSSQSSQSSKATSAYQQKSASDTVATELAFLKAYKGKYPAQVKLLDNTLVRKRLMAITGPEYPFLVKFGMLKS